MKIKEEAQLGEKFDSEDIKQRIEQLESSVKGRWSPEEDEKIMKAFKKFGRNWALIAKSLEGRNAKQVRERYINYLEKR